MAFHQHAFNKPLLIWFSVAVQHKYWLLEPDKLRVTLLEPEPCVQAPKPIVAEN